MKIEIDDKRVLVWQPFDRRFVAVMKLLEGARRWLRSGAYSFEATPANLARLEQALPGALVSGGYTGARPVGLAAPATAALGGFGAGLGRLTPARAPTAASDDPDAPDDPFAAYAMARGQGVALGASLVGKTRPGAPHGAGQAQKPASDAASRLYARAAFGQQPPGATRPAFAPVMPPSPSQAAGIAHLGGLPVLALTGVVGSGKTKLALDLTMDHYCGGRIDGMIVIAPNGVDEQWIDTAIPAHVQKDVKVHGFCIAKGKRAFARFEKMLADDKAFRVLALNIEAVTAKLGRTLIEMFLQKLGRRVFVWIDESHRIGNPSSNAAKVLCGERGHAGINARVDYRGIMTGTPMQKSPLNIYSQYKFLDERILGFRYMTAFRAEFCIMGGHEGQQIVGVRNPNELARRVLPYTFRVDEKELGLKEPVYKEYRFEMAADQRAIYNQMKTQFLAEIQDQKTYAANGGVALTRLQQISCGYLPMDDGSIQQFSNPRMAALESIIDQLPGVKRIIWARFNYDVEQIMLMLKARGVKAVDYYGQTEKKDNRRKWNLEQFIDDPATTDFVASPAAAGTGLDGLQHVCRHAIYYSKDFNAVNYWQSRGRIQRVGMGQHATFIDIIGRGTIDVKQRAALQARQDMADLLIDDIRKALQNDQND